MKKPTEPAREFISPSDLTFGLSTCKRCLWLKYWFKLVAPGQFPLLKTLSSTQEEYFRHKRHEEISPLLRPGKVKQWGQWVRSEKIAINGDQTRWRINGIYDLLGHNDDGTVAIIDCKVSDSDRDNAAFYAPQLEAYAYAIEHPASAKAFDVATMGLLVWKLDHEVWKSNEKVGFSTNEHYLPIERNREGFQLLITDLITVLEGDEPEPGENCEVCAYVAMRTSLL